MILWLDRKYIQLLGSKLDGFVTKSQNLFNCRCPICGDSKSNKRLKRFYFYEKDNQFVAYCHNCLYSSNIKNLLKRLDYRLYQEYQLETLQDVGVSRIHRTGSDTHNNTISQPGVQPSHAQHLLRQLQTVNRLPEPHACVQYIRTRSIPRSFEDRIYWSSAFMEWTNEVVPGSFSEKACFFDEGRIVIPYFDKDKNLFAFSGRSILPNAEMRKRYLHIVIDKTIPLIYGLDRFDTTKKGYVVEGQFDSMFIPNCLAMSGSNLNMLTSIPHHDKLTVIFDNEPRSKDTKKKINSAIERGYKVCIWPTWVEQKDINKMVMDGMSPEYVKDIIDKSTYQGLEAKVRNV